MDKICLVVLSHNNWKVTNKFLESLYRHTDRDRFYLYFIDNGSSDETPEKLKEIESKVGNMKVVLNEDNNGVIGGRNQGFDWFFDHDEFEYIMFLDNDQFVQPNWLEQHLGVLNRGYDIIGVEAWQLNKNFMPVQKNTRLNEWFSYVGCGGSLIRRQTANEVGKFDVQFNPSYFEDPDYIFRASDKGFKIGWNFRAKITHLPHQTLGNAQDKRQRFQRSLQRFKAKWHKRNPPMFRQTSLPEFEL